MAVLLVLAYHAGLPVRGGFIGVDVFFVISGFIITGSLVKEIQTRHAISLSGFYARRAKRLLPATAAVLLATGVCTVLLLPRTRWVSTGWDIAASALYVQNWRLQQQAVDYVAQNQAAGPLQHFWSLAVEEQFYLIWPGVLLLATAIPRRFSTSRAMRSDAPYAKWLLAGVAMVVVPSFVTSVFYTQHNPSSAYFATFTRLWELGIGGGLAIASHWLLKTPPRVAAGVGWLGLAAVAWSAFALSDGTAYPGTMALMPVLGAAAVIGAGAASGGLGPVALLATRPMVSIGGMSYSLYLWHWPVLVIAGATLGRDLSPIEGVVAVMASTLLAWLGVRLVENPFRFNRSYVTQPSRALRMGAFSTLIGVFVGIGLLLAMYPPAPPIQRTGVAIRDLLPGPSVGAVKGPLGARALGSNPRTSPAGLPVDKVSVITPEPEQALDDSYGEDCIARESATSADPCVLGEPGSDVLVAVVGDSHAAQWTLPLQAIAERRRWRLEIFAMQNCTWARNVTVDLNGRPYKNCAVWGDDVARTLRADPPDLLILSSVARPAYGETDRSSATLVDGYIERWRPLVDAGARVVVLQDTPRPPMDEHECVVKNRQRLTRCSFDKRSHLTNNGALALAAESELVSRNIDLSDAICPRRRCAAVIGGVLVYRDNNHLTATYAGSLAPRLDKLLPRLAPR